MTRTATKSKRLATRKPVRKVAAKPVARRPAAPGTSIRSYRGALEFLSNQTDYEKMSRVGYNQSNFNLSRMLRILSKVGNPHKKLRCIHIAGTKGKGSTCHMISSVIQYAGYRTGLYTSPHFVDMRERIQVDGQVISEAEFTRLIAKLAPIAIRMQRQRPTFFELITAAALMHFVNAKVDFAVIETGLGGRLDSTNVVKPAVTAITSISYDHVALLGNTLEKIAEEKAGIFKAGVPAISAPQPPGVRRVLRRVAEKVGCDLRILGEDLEFSYRFESSRSTGPHTRVCLFTANTRIDHVQVPLLGEHQAHNCGVALGVIDVLRRVGIDVTEQDAIDGLARTHAPGRLEIIREAPRTIVDAAHNAASVAALMRAIGQNISYDSMVVIFGCAADKDIDGMLEQIQLGADKVIFTNNGSTRSANPNELLLRFLEKTQKMVQIAPSLREAYRIARNCVTRDDLICITGSTYLVGEAKKLLAAGELD